MIISGILVTLAHNALLFMTGRALLGIVIGGFWAISTAIVMRLVPFNHVPKAFRTLNGGNALAITIATPLGSFRFNHWLAWRFLLYCSYCNHGFTLATQKYTIFASLEYATKIWICIFSVKRPVFILGMLDVLFLFMESICAVYLFASILRKRNNGQYQYAVNAPLDLGSGRLGWNLRDQSYFTSPCVPLPVLYSKLAWLWLQQLLFFGHQIWIVALLMTVWGFIGTSAPVAWNTWLTRTFPHDAELGGGLMVAIIQLAITLGATLGGAYCLTLKATSPHSSLARRF